MKNAKSAHLSAAVSGLLFGTAGTPLTTCPSSPGPTTEERRAGKGTNAGEGRSNDDTAANSLVGKHTGKDAGKGRGARRAPKP